MCPVERATLSLSGKVNHKDGIDALARIYFSVCRESYLDITAFVAFILPSQILARNERAV
jgi:hypothetical protein